MARVRPVESVAASFHRIMPKLLRRYFRKGRALTRSRAPNEKLHSFRIRTKQIRYITELYQEAFAYELRGALKQFRRVQQALGALQDQCMLCACLERRLKQLRNPAPRAECRRVLDRSRARQKSLRKAFFRRWRNLERSGFPKRLLARFKKGSR